MTSVGTGIFLTDNGSVDPLSTGVLRLDGSCVIKAHRRLVYQIAARELPIGIVEWRIFGNSADSPPFQFAGLADEIVECSSHDERVEVSRQLWEVVKTYYPSQRDRDAYRHLLNKWFRAAPVEEFPRVSKEPTIAVSSQFESRRRKRARELIGAAAPLLDRVPPNENPVERWPHNRYRVGLEVVGDRDGREDSEFRLDFRPDW